MPLVVTLMLFYLLFTFRVDAVVLLFCGRCLICCDFGCVFVWGSVWCWVVILEFMFCWVSGVCDADSSCFGLILILRWWVGGVGCGCLVKVLVPVG